MKLYSNICPASGESLDDIRRRIQIKGLMSVPNIGTFDKNGAPLPLKHLLPVEFTPNYEAQMECVTAVIDTDDVTSYFRAHSTSGTNLPIAKFDDFGKFERECTDKGKEIEQYDAIHEQMCRFGIPPHLIKTSGSNYQWEVPTPDASWNPEAINTAEMQDIRRSGLDPLKYKDVAFYTFKKAWGNQVPNTVTKAKWDAEYFDRFLKWKDRVGEMPFPSVSLLTHTLVNIDDTIGTGNPNLRNIKSWGMEVECEAGAIDEGSARAAGYTVEADGSGVREVQTHPFENPRELFRELTRFSYIQHGAGQDNGTGQLRSCGSHLHVRTERPHFEAFYHTFRHLIPLFVPYFAGTTPEGREEFRLSHRRGHWASLPPDRTQRDLEDWENNHRQHEWTWVTPHAKTSVEHAAGGVPQNKPLTFEFRLNEAVAPSSVTGVRLLSRIANAFIDVGYKPKWSNDLLTFGTQIINDNSSIRKIHQVTSKLTDDARTAEIVSKVFGHEVKPGQSVNIQDVSKWMLDTLPMEDYENMWVNNIANKVTWSRVLKSGVNYSDLMNLTRMSQVRTKGWWVDSPTRVPQRQVNAASPPIQPPVVASPPSPSPTSTPTPTSPTPPPQPQAQSQTQPSPQTARANTPQVERTPVTDPDNTGRNVPQTGRTQGTTRPRMPDI